MTQINRTKQCRKCFKFFSSPTLLTRHLESTRNYRGCSGIPIQREYTEDYIISNDPSSEYISKNAENFIKQIGTSNLRSRQKNQCLLYKFDRNKKQVDCGKILFGYTKIKKHIIQSHTNIEKMYCQLCQKKFVKRNDLVYHQRRNHQHILVNNKVLGQENNNGDESDDNESQGSNSENTTEQEQDEQSQLKNNRGGGYFQFYCDKEVPITQKASMSYIKNFNPKKCQSILNSIREHNNHALIEHPTLISRHICKYCGLFNFRYFWIETHEKQHLNGYFPKPQFYIFECRLPVYFQNQINNKDYKQTYIKCRLKFFSEFYRLEHQTKDHLYERSFDEKRIKCEKCQYFTTDMKQLDKHWINTHKLNHDKYFINKFGIDVKKKKAGLRQLALLQQQLGDTVPLNMMQCEIVTDFDRQSKIKTVCDQSFSDRHLYDAQKKLDAHYKTHQDITIYVCWHNDCNKLFKVLKTYLQHLRQHKYFKKDDE